jgi:rhomboid protease GluP
LLLRRGPAQGLSFEELAGTIEARVTEPYARSFEELVAATPGSPVPSTGELGVLQAYAQQRVEASREVAEGFRTRDPYKIRQGLEQAKQARAASQGMPPAPPVSAAPLSK